MHGEYDLRTDCGGETEWKEEKLMNCEIEGMIKDGVQKEESLTALLRQQNELLADLVCAISGLTGAMLACCRSGEKRLEEEKD